MNLVTGATGIVGAHIALRLLEAGKPVKAIKRPGSDVSKTKKLFRYYNPNATELFDKIMWVDADICDVYSLLDALENVTNVYHCAGFVSFNSKDTHELHKVNAEGTANMVNACLEKQINALCHVSSIATLQNPDITHNIDESVYWKSSPYASTYAISKYNGEREVWRGIEEGLNAVIVNPGVIISPGFWGQSSGKIIASCYKGTSFYTEGGTATIDARDLAKCMMDLTEQKQFGKRFVLTENNYSFKEIFSVFQTKFHKSPPSIKAGKWLLRLASLTEGFLGMFTGNEKRLTKDAMRAALEKNTYNNHKIVNTLGCQFIPLSQSAEFVCYAYLNDQKS